MSSVKIENSTLSLYIDDIGKWGKREEEEKKTKSEFGSRE